jgi:hypothetical protein
MTLWQHAFNWAYAHGIRDAFGYAEWYADEYPDGECSHPSVYEQYAELTEGADA